MTSLIINEHKYDRVSRIVIGVVLISAGIFIGGTWGVVLGVVGLVPLITGFLGWCPLYALFGINSCNIKPG